MVLGRVKYVVVLPSLPSGAAGGGGGGLWVGAGSTIKARYILYIHSEST